VKQAGRWQQPPAPRPTWLERNEGGGVIFFLPNNNRSEVSAKISEIRHVEVKKIGGKITVSVVCQELSSWADVTFEVDDDENQPSLFCKVSIHGCGRHNEVIVVPDFVAIEDKDGTVLSVRCEGEAKAE
jgi:hypothetical protein